MSDAGTATGGNPRLADRSHPILADRSTLAAVCIDMGSVVVNERPTWTRWQSLALQHLRKSGVNVGPKELRLALREAMIAHAPRVSSHAFSALGGDPVIPQQIWKEFANRDRPLPYADAALARLAARHKLVMVANQGLHARTLLEGAGLDRHFSLLLLSDELSIAKPDERIFRMALDHLGVEPERVAMLGDRFDLDIEPSRRLGMLAIRIRRGPFACQEPARPEQTPHLTFNSLTNAARWLAP
ncbi:MAG TPA: HAD family hydrolase [Chloroflexota bacterium]|nr:HAD family hydrolase [Chloroflexota bacterium]